MREQLRPPPLPTDNLQSLSKPTLSTSDTINLFDMQITFRDGKTICRFERQVAMGYELLMWNALRPDIRYDGFNTLIHLFSSVPYHFNNIFV